MKITLTPDGLPSILQSRVRLHCRQHPPPPPQCPSFICRHAGARSHLLLSNSTLSSLCSCGRLVLQEACFFSPHDAALFCEACLDFELDSLTDPHTLQPVPLQQAQLCVTRALARCKNVTLAAGMDATASVASAVLCAPPSCIPSTSLPAAAAAAAATPASCSSAATAHGPPHPPPPLHPALNPSCSPCSPSTSKLALKPQSRAPAPLSWLTPSAPASGLPSKSRRRLGSRKTWTSACAYPPHTVT